MKKKLLLGQLQKGLKIDEIEYAEFYRYYLGEISFDNLTPIKQEKLERYRKIWAQYCQGINKTDILSFVMKDYGIELRQAQVDYVTAVKLHGPLDIVDRDGRKIASMHYFDLLAEKAKLAGDYDIAIKARIEADKCAGIFEADNEGMDPKLWTKAAKVQYIIKVDNHFQGNQEIIELDE